MEDVLLDGVLRPVLGDEVVLECAREYQVELRISLWPTHNYY